MIPYIPIIRGEKKQFIIEDELVCPKEQLPPLVKADTKPYKIRINMKESPIVNPPLNQ